MPNDSLMILTSLKVLDSINLNGLQYIISQPIHLPQTFLLCADLIFTDEADLVECDLSPSLHHNWHHQI